MSAQRAVSGPYRQTRDRGTAETVSAARRFVRAAGRRAGDGDEVELADLLTLRAEVEAAIEVAVVGQRERFSWAYIGRGLGVTKNAAIMRYGKVARGE